MRIGNIELPGIPVFLGPMAGVTDLPYRVICRRYGADMTCTEMVSAKAMYYKNRGTAALLITGEDEVPVTVQLFGSEPELMADMAQTIENSFDIIDINMGCPMAKIVGNHEGSYLMKEPELASRIISTMAKRLKKPVTVKIRAGFAGSPVSAPEFAKMAEDAGAAAIAVHGRTREQYYSGKADWDIIRRVKDAVSVPVIGNGDISDGASAVRMVRETGADGIMIARAARGCPWIFREIKAALSGHEAPETPSSDEICSVILGHAAGLAGLKGEYTAVREMRKHLAWYSAGRDNSASFRAAINDIATLPALNEAVVRFFGE